MLDSTAGRLPLSQRQNTRRSVGVASTKKRTSLPRERKT
nr:MAG TPA: hypothetical protein [Caudoviricetes sp.]